MAPITITKYRSGHTKEIQFQIPLPPVETFPLIAFFVILGLEWIMS